MIPTDLTQARYVSLVTYRRDGREVPTPVWAAEDSGELLIWTRADSGKVKRLRRDPAVTVAPCDWRGRLASDAEHWKGQSRLLEDKDGLDRVRRAMARAHGWQFRLLDSGGWLLRLGSRPHTGIGITFSG